MAFLLNTFFTYLILFPTTLSVVIISSGMMMFRRFIICRLVMVVWMIMMTLVMMVVVVNRGIGILYWGQIGITKTCYPSCIAHYFILCWLNGVSFNFSLLFSQSIIEQSSLHCWILKTLFIFFYIKYL